MGCIACGGSSPPSDTSKASLIFEMIATVDHLDTSKEGEASNLPEAIRSG